jgi:hypothetical protein
VLTFCSGGFEFGVDEDAVNHFNFFLAAQIKFVTTDQPLRLGIHQVSDHVAQLR